MNLPHLPISSLGSDKKKELLHIEVASGVTVAYNIALTWE